MMKRTSISMLVLCAAAVLGDSSPAHAAGGFGTTTLQPHETKQFSFEAVRRTRVGWRSPKLDITRAQQCPDELCVELKQLGDAEQSVQSMFGGALTFDSKDGLVELALTNRADFPILVEIYRE